MEPHSLFPWPRNPEEAIEIQNSLRLHVRLCRLSSVPNRIAGADVSYFRDAKTLCAAVAVLASRTLDLLDQAIFIGPVPFPYIPGMLGFREVPPLLEAFSRLSILPDLIFFDGHGTFHPRGFGLASHMGVLLDIPAIGCAKNPFYKEIPMAGKNRGSWKSMRLSPLQRGASVRTKTNCNPVFVSAGHRITLRESIRWVLKTTGRFRLPEPIRQAHILANQVRVKST